MSTITKRLTREDWLSLALEHLAKGQTGLTIDKFVESLGVTKGSFYWHFRNLKEFQVALVDYWDTHFTQNVIENLEHMEAGPGERLWVIMETVCKNDLARYDVAVRAWAMQKKELTDRVRSVDESRIRTVRALFRELGFSGKALAMRTRTFVTYVSLELGLSIHQSKRQRIDCMREYHALITSDIGPLERKDK